MIAVSPIHVWLISESNVLVFPKDCNLVLGESIDRVFNGSWNLKREIVINDVVPMLNISLFDCSTGFLESATKMLQRPDSSINSSVAHSKKFEWKKGVYRWS